MHAGPDDVSSPYHSTEASVPVFDAHDPEMENMVAAAAAEAQAAAIGRSCNARPVTGVTCYLSSGRATTLTGIAVSKSTRRLPAGPRGRLLAQADASATPVSEAVKGSLAAAVALEAASTMPHPSLELQGQQSTNSSSTKRVVKVRRSFASGARGSV